MHLQLACADYAFPLLAHDDALHLIHRLGFSGVDVGLFPGATHFGPDDYLEDPEGGARKLSDLAQRHGLEIADIFLQSGHNLEALAENHPDKQQRQRAREVFMRTLEMAFHARVQHLTSLPGIVWSEDPPGVSLERSAEELAWRVEEAQRAGVLYAIEPHLWSVVPTPEAVLRLIELTPGLTLSLDYSHFVVQGFASEQLEPLARHASHVHARAAARGLLQAPLAINEVNFKSLLGWLRSAGFRGWIAVEYVRLKDVPQVPNVDNLAETILMRDLLRMEWAASNP